MKRAVLLGLLAIAGFTGCETERGERAEWRHHRNAGGSYGPEYPVYQPPTRDYQTYPYPAPPPDYRYPRGY